jgi:hypothetical protein
VVDERWLSVYVLRTIKRISIKTIEGTQELMYAKPPRCGCLLEKLSVWRDDCQTWPWRDLAAIAEAGVLRSP